MTLRYDALDVLVTPPTDEPVTVDQVRAALRFTSTSEDDLLTGWIAAARQVFEDQTGRQILTATWDYWLPIAPSGNVIELPHPPLQAVESVTIDPTTSPATTFDATNYTVIAPNYPTCPRGRLVLAEGSSWPTLGSTAYPLRIRYRAGYVGGSPSDLPELITATIYLLVEHFHSRRAEGFGAVIEALLRNFKYTAYPTVPLWTTVPA